MSYTHTGRLKQAVTQTRCCRTYLLFQGHDCVHSEVATLTRVGDAHRAGQKEPSSQHLQAAPSKHTRPTQISKQRPIQRGQVKTWTERDPTCRPRSGTGAAWTGCSSPLSGPATHMTSPHHMTRPVHARALWVFLSNPAVYSGPGLTGLSSRYVVLPASPGSRE